MSFLKSCPKCKNKEMFESKNMIICLDCGLEFDKKILKLIMDKSEIIEKKNNKILMEKLMKTENLESFIQILNSINDFNYCFYCLSKVNNNTQICPKCGTILNQIENTIDTKL